ncbi:MAG: hypothetical protein ACRDWY_10615, partial [Actinomycetes bacterium]
VVDMSDQIWPRLGAATGAVYVLALMGGPSLGQGTVVVAAELVALTLFVAFAAYLTSILRAAEGPGAWLAPTVLAAVAVDTAIKFAGIGAGHAARDLPDGRLHDVLHEMNNVSFIVTMMPLALATAATSVVVLRTGVLPRAFGWSGLAVAAALVANGAALGSEFGPAFLAFLAWTLALSIRLSWRAPLVPVTTGEAVPVG